MPRNTRSDVSVRVLGCGDAFGSGGRSHTSFYLQTPTTRLLIDCGASALVSMHRFGVDPGTIDAVVLSHLHGDHFGGLPFLLLDAAFVTRRTRPLIIAGPRGTPDRLRRTTELLFPAFWRTHGRSHVQFIELADRRPRQVAGATVTPFAVVHKSGAPAFALRVSCNGCTVAYSGDTAWTDALLEASCDADLFLCEASSFATPIPYHLTYQTIAAHRKDIRAARLVLTHLGPEMLSRRSKLAVECATDGQRIAIRRRARGHSRR